MCGIAGYLGPGGEEKVHRMLDAMAHRGPDGRGVVVGAGGAALGHVRLAIVDPAGGAQPLTNEDGTLWIACNGEVYNWRDVARDLRGHRLRTGSDSEVVLHLLEEQGPAALGRLLGMFALALWDGRDGLLLVRDPLGIKPL